MAQNIVELAKKVDQLCPELVAPSWWPVTSDTKPRSKPAALASIFGGTAPWTPPNDAHWAWPMCTECDEPKTFFCQLNFKDMPRELQRHVGRSDGLFQLFYCQECCDHGVSPDVRIIQDKELGTNTLKHLAGVAVSSSNQPYARLPKMLIEFVEHLNGESSRKLDFDPNNFGNPPMKEFFVTRWRKSKMREIPQLYDMIVRHPQVLDRLGITENELMAVGDFGLDDLYIESEDEDDKKVAGDLTVCRNGVKLGGFISFIQDPEYPECPDCKVRMTKTFLQMCQSDELSYEWGGGTAHVTLCPECGRPGIGWACG